MKLHKSISKTFCSIKDTWEYEQPGQFFSNLSLRAERTSRCGEKLGPFERKRAQAFGYGRTEVLPHLHQSGQWSNINVETLIEIPLNALCEGVSTSKYQKLKKLKRRPRTQNVLASVRSRLATLSTMKSPAGEQETRRREIGLRWQVDTDSGNR